MTLSIVIGVFGFVQWPMEHFSVHVVYIHSSSLKME